MISGFISNKCIAQERLDQAQKQYDKLNSKLKAMDNPLDFVTVKIQTPNFPQLEIDRNIFCDNYSQTLREFPSFRQIPEMSYEGNKRIADLLNNYKLSVGLSKILDTADDFISEENYVKKPIQDNTYNSTPIPSNPYGNLAISGKGGAQGLLNQFVAGEFYKNLSDTQSKDYIQESNKNNLIRTFKQKTGLGDHEAIFYLEMNNYDLQKSLEFFNNNK